MTEKHRETGAGNPTPSGKAGGAPIEPVGLLLSAGQKRSHAEQLYLPHLALVRYETPNTHRMRFTVPDPRTRRHAPLRARHHQWPVRSVLFLPWSMFRPVRGADRAATVLFVTSGARPATLLPLETTRQRQRHSVLVLSHAYMCPAGPLSPLPYMRACNFWGLDPDRSITIARRAGTRMPLPLDPDACRSLPSRSQ